LGWVDSLGQILYFTSINLGWIGSFGQTEEKNEKKKKKKCIKIDASKF